MLVKVINERPANVSGKKAEEYLTFEKLNEACNRASADTQIISEIEDINRTITTKGLKVVKSLDADETVYETETRALTPADLAEKLSLFDKLSLSEQIDKADSYLLSFLLTQRNLVVTKRIQILNSGLNSMKSSIKGWQQTSKAIPQPILILKLDLY